jgi:hypothetical protein
MRSVWGLMAALSLGVVVAASIDDTGQQRIAALFVPGEMHVAGDFATQSEFADLSAEITRLRSETRLLALEREAMAIKIAALESEFGPITGSIPDPANSDPAEIAGETVAETELEAAAVTEEDLREQAAESGPLEPKSVRTIDVGFVPLPKERKNAISPEAAATDEPSIDPGVDGPPAPATAGSEPDKPSETMAAAVDPANEETELATLASPLARVIPSSVAQTHFAIQLGVADTMTDVRAMWTSISNEHDLLVGRLEPAVAIAEEKNKIRVRLLAGPFNDAADAIQLCTMLIERGVDCRAVRNEGQKLVMR